MKEVMIMDQFIKKLENGNIERTTLKSFIAKLQRQIEVQNENKVVFGSTSTHKNAGAEVAIIRDYALVGEEGAKLAKQILVDGKNASELTVKQVNFKVN